MVSQAGNVCNLEEVKWLAGSTHWAMVPQSGPASIKPILATVSLRGKLQIYTIGQNLPPMLPSYMAWSDLTLNG
jgi:hypothetical protein